MRLEKDDAKIGLLVFLTLALFVGFIFKRSLNSILRKETQVKVRLESASDVAEGTVVQLQGLQVGRVESVRLHRDGVQYWILATLGLRTDILLWEGTRVLVVAKPLGGAYLDLQLPPPAARREALAPGSVLAGTEGPSLATLIDAITALVANVDQGVDEVRHQLQAKGLGAVLDHPQVRRAFLDLDQALRSFQALAEDSRTLVRQGGGSLRDLDRTVAALGACIDQVRTLLDSHRDDLDAIVVNLAGTLEQMQGLGRELRALVQQAGPDGEASLKSLDRTLRATEELLELLKAKPNRLLWGKPTPAEQAAAARKVEALRQAQGAKP